MKEGAWPDILSKITQNDQYETDVLILAWASYLLKWNPALFWLGYIFDFAVDVIIFEKKDLRKEIYEFMLDSNNYPNISDYVSKIKGYTQEYLTIREYDLQMGVQNDFALLFFGFVIILVFFPFAFLIEIPLTLFGWPFILSYTLWITLPSYDWVQSPLLWFPN